MTVKGQPVSQTSAGEWCLLNEDHITAEHVELDKYEVVHTINGSIWPVCDERFPKGSPIKDHYRVGNQIVKNLDVTS